jgi:two-component sensor histidine kinase
VALARKDLDGPLGYAFGAACFAAAVILRMTTNVWYQTHYPYMTFFLSVIVTCSLAGIGPALLVVSLSAIGVYFTYTPASYSPPPSAYAGAGMFILVTLLCVGVIGSVRQSRTRLRIERERYAALAETRDLLYRELKHRVSNNIQIIAGLLQLQGLSARDGASRRALKEASERIALVAKIQSELYENSGEAAPFRRFAEELVADALAAAGATEVQVDFDCGEAVLQAEQATCVSLVMLECVNNALEHAFAGGAAGTIKIVLGTEGDRQVLVVRDDGKGLPDGFQPEEGKSLGLKIVRAMAAQLGGQFSIDPASPGAACRLIFPLAA